MSKKIIYDMSQSESLIMNSNTWTGVSKLTNYMTNNGY